MNRHLILFLFVLIGLNAILWTDTPQTPVKRPVALSEISTSNVVAATPLLSKIPEAPALSTKNKVTWVHKNKKNKIQVRVSKSKTISITKIVQNKTVLNFICQNEFLSRAFETQQKTGVLVATIVAQKGMESNWGRSRLTILTKNLSNIKCTNKKCKSHNIRLRYHHQMGSVTAHCVQLWDDKPSDRFVRLRTNYDGWITYRKLLGNKRYARVGRFRTIREQSMELQRAGWATSKKYSKNLMTAVQQYNLGELQRYINAGYTITTSDGKYVLLDQS